MRLLRSGECFALALAAVFVFCIANWIGSATRDATPPIWTRTCTAKMDSLLDKEIVTCGKFVDERRVDHAVALIAATSKPVKCRAYQTRGIYGKIDLDCG